MNYREIGDLADAIGGLTQSAIDRAASFTQHPGLLEAWHTRCHQHAACLLAGTPETAVRSAQTIVMFAFPHEAPADFWRTDLGQLLYRSGGFPPRDPSKVEAAHILQVSHQAISDLIKRGGLIENNGRVDTKALRARWDRRFRRTEDG